MQTFFVSSTFRDMQFERDAIQNIAVPKINEVAKKYGQSVSFCDLRWGINTLDLDTDYSSRKVLDVCLDRIDRCQSPMVVILGDRYGFIPDEKIIKTAAKKKNLKLDDFAKSVTALEIEYGTFRPGSKGKTLYYYRNLKNPPEGYGCEDGEHEEKLNKLKERLQNLSEKVNCKQYDAGFENGVLHGAKEFALMLADDIIETLKPEWEEFAKLSPFEQDRKVQWNFIREKSALFKGREGVLGELVGQINSGKRMITVKGDTGSGKSTLFASLATGLESIGWDVFPFIGGLTSESNDAFDILRNSVRYLEDKLGIAGHFGQDQSDANISAWRKELQKLAERYCALGNKFVIMVDAVDQLFDDDNRKGLAFIPAELDENFRFICTCNTSFKELSSDCYFLKSLGKEEKDAVLESILERHFKELDKQVKDKIMSLSTADNPLYLSFLIQRLMLMNIDDYTEIDSLGDGMKSISAHQLKILNSCPDSCEEMCACLIDETAKLINPQLVTKTMQYLAFSRYGLREADLRALTGDKWDTLDFMHFISLMNEWFIQHDDGRYDFAHKSIREGIRKTYSGCSASREILQYLKGLPEDDKFKQSEIIYHIIATDDKAYYRQYASELLLQNKDNSNPVNPLISAIKASYESAVEDGGKWLSSVVEQTPVCEDTVGFIAYLMLLSSIFISSYSNVNASLKINESFVGLAQKFARSGISSGQAILNSARANLGFSYLQAGEGGSIGYFADVYKTAYNYYKETPSTDTFTSLLVATRQYVVNLCELEGESDDKTRNEILDATNSTLEIAKSLYTEDKNKGTATNLFIATTLKALSEVLIKNIDQGLAIHESAFDIIEPYLGELETEQEFLVVIESCTPIVNFLLTLIVNRIHMRDTYGADQMPDAEFQRKFEQIIANDIANGGHGDFGDLLDKLNEEAEERRANDQISRMVERENFPAYIEKIKALYAKTQNIIDIASKKFNQSVWGAMSFNIEINIGTILMTGIDDTKAAEQYFLSALEHTKNTEEEKLSFDTKFLLMKCKAMLALCYASSDDEEKISKGMDMAKTAVTEGENLIAVNDSVFVKDALSTAYMAFSLLCEKTEVDGMEAFKYYEKLINLCENDVRLMQINGAALPQIYLCAVNAVMQSGVLDNDTDRKMQDLYEKCCNYIENAKVMLEAIGNTMPSLEISFQLDAVLGLREKLCALANDEDSLADAIIENKSNKDYILYCILDSASGDNDWDVYNFVEEYLDYLLQTINEHKEDDALLSSILEDESNLLDRADKLTRGIFSGSINYVKSVYEQSKNIWFEMYEKLEADGAEEFEDGEDFDFNDLFPDDDEE